MVHEREALPLSAKQDDSLRISFSKRTRVTFTHPAKFELKLVGAPLDR